MNEAETVRAKRKKIGVFFDGAYAEKIREAEGWEKTFYGQLIPVLHHQAAEWLGVEPDRCAVPTQQWFRGMLTSAQVHDKVWEDRKRLLHHERECDLLVHLCLARIDVHRRPMEIVEGKPKEKGIDQLLQARTVHAIETEDLDAVVLVAGDSDHLTLFEEVTKKGARTILVWYENENPKVKSSFELIQRADRSFRLHYVDGTPQLRPDRKARQESVVAPQARNDSRHRCLGCLSPSSAPIAWRTLTTRPCGGQGATQRVSC